MAHLFSHLSSSIAVVAVALVVETSPHMSQSALAVRGSVDATSPRDGQAAVTPVADFNGDGRADLVLGVPGEAVGSIAAAGAVNLIYGSANGLTSKGNQVWTQDSTDIQGTPEVDDEFGFAVVAGDFDRDGFADLAVGVPLEDSNEEDAGGVNVLYGSAAGISAAGNQFWTLDSEGIEGTERQDAEFGRSLAAGDFDGDGFADLAVGVPLDDPGGVIDGGQVAILYGSPAGLASDRSQIWSQDSSGISDSAQEGDAFGFALAAGDFDADGFADLGVGVPSEDGPPGLEDAGAVSVIYGSSSGLTSDGNQFWTQDTEDVEGGREVGDRFGYSLVGGTFDGDQFADLAVGVPFEDIRTIREAGAVNVLYGSAGGLTADGNQVWSQDSDGIVNPPEAGDEFGFAVAAGDFDRDGASDLACGVPGEDGTKGVDHAGAANVIYGSSGGLTSAGNQYWRQGSDGVQGSREQGDQFGFSVAAGNFGSGNQTDLALGVPFEDLDGPVDAGAVNVLYGSAGGLSGDDDQLWTQKSDEIEGAAEDGDRLGRSD